MIINSASMSWQTTVLVLSNIGRTGQKNCRSRRCKDVRFPAENGMPLRLSSWHSRPFDNVRFWSSRQSAKNESTVQVLSESSRYREGLSAATFAAVRLARRC